MKKLLLILVVFCITTTTVSAQAVSEAKIRQQIEAAAASMKTMQCDFVQTKFLRMLNDKMVSRGKMYYQQSDNSVGSTPRLMPMLRTEWLTCSDQ